MNLNMTTGILVSILILGLLAVIFASVNSDIYDDMVTDGDNEAAVIANYSLDGIDNFTKRLGLVGTIGGFLVILALVAVILQMFGGGYRE